LQLTQFFVSHNLKVIKNSSVQILVVAVGQSFGFLLSLFHSSVFHKVQMQIHHHLKGFLCFWKKSLMLTKAAFIWSKIQ